jgi:hypothetical protein
MRRIAVARAPGGIKMTGQTQKAHRANNAVFPLFNVCVRQTTSCRHWSEKNRFLLELVWGIG